MRTATRSEKQGIHSDGPTTAVTDHPPSKIARFLRNLQNDGSLNSFEAEQVYNQCLNSTISDLSNHHGLIFQVPPEKVPSNWDQPCDVTRHSLPHKGCEQWPFDAKPKQE